MKCMSFSSKNFFYYKLKYGIRPAFLRCLRDPLELKIGSLESEKIIKCLESEKIASLQVHTRYLTFSLKKLD